MIVVTGASGQLGRLVVEELAANVGPSQIVATARSTGKLADLVDRGITVRELDYGRPATITAALDGATQVLLISSSEIGRRVDQHRNVIEAATAAGVEHLAYTSLLRADSSGLLLATEHKATEDLLAACGLTVSRLRHGWYTENYTQNLGPALANGAFIGAAGQGRIAAATRADYAAADAAVLADPARWGGTYELAGPAFTMAELAAAVSEAAGRPIGYLELPGPDLRAALVGAGLPELMADFLVDADFGIARGDLDGDPSLLAELIGRQPTPLAAAVAVGLATTPAG